MKIIKFLLITLFFCACESIPTTDYIVETQYEQAHRSYVAPYDYTRNRTNRPITRAYGNLETGRVLHYPDMWYIRTKRGLILSINQNLFEDIYVYMETTNKPLIFTYNKYLGGKIINLHSDYVDFNKSEVLQMVGM